MPINDMTFWQNWVESYWKINWNAWIASKLFSG